MKRYEYNRCVVVWYSGYEVLDCGVRSSYPRRAVPRVLVVFVVWSGGDLPSWLGMIRGLLSFPSRRMGLQDYGFATCLYGPVVLGKLLCNVWFSPPWNIPGRCVTWRKYTAGQIVWSGLLRSCVVSTVALSFITNWFHYSSVVNVCGHYTSVSKANHCAHHVWSVIYRHLCYRSCAELVCVVSIYVRNQRGRAWCGAWCVLVCTLEHMLYTYTVICAWWRIRRTERFEMPRADACLRAERLGDCKTVESCP